MREYRKQQQPTEEKVVSEKERTAKPVYGTPGDGMHRDVDPNSKLVRDMVAAAKELAGGGYV